MNVSANYFTVTFAMLLIERIKEFSKGMMWIPILHGIMFVIIMFIDKKDTKESVKYKHYTKMKIYQCFKSDEELMK